MGLQWRSYGSKFLLLLILQKSILTLITKTGTKLSSSTTLFGGGCLVNLQSQERLLGAPLGCIVTGVIVLEHRRSIYESITETRPNLPPKSRVSEPIIGQSRSEFAHLWNKGVDQTFRPVIEALSSLGW